MLATIVPQVLADNGGDDETTGYIVFGAIFFGIILIIILAVHFSFWKKCPKCGKRKAKWQKDNILKQPGTSYEGKRESFYHCMNCGHDFSFIENILKDDDSVQVKSGTRHYESSSRGSRSSSRSRGSWSGGSTSGGGAGSKW